MMTAETALRQAVLRLLPFAQDSRCQHVSDLAGNEDSKSEALAAARAALALVPGESRVECRILFERNIGEDNWESDERGPMCLEDAAEWMKNHAHYRWRRNCRVESRSIGTSHWTLLEVHA